MRKSALALLLILAGCAVGGQPLTPEQNMAVMCRAYPATLNGLAPFKSQMSGAQIEAVDRARAVVRPLCTAAATGTLVDIDAALRAVRAELRAMLLIEQEVK